MSKGKYQKKGNEACAATPNTVPAAETVTTDVQPAAAAPDATSATSNGPFKTQDVIEIAAAQDQLNQLKRSIDPDSVKSKNPIGRLIDWAFAMRDSHVKRPVSRKTYLWLCLLGAFGAHRFYAHQWFTAILYLLFCWTGVPLAMTLIDVLIVIPMKPDENGNIMM